LSRANARHAHSLYVVAHGSRHLPQVVAVFNRMTQGNLIEVLRTYDAALREIGATALFIFGSRARGTERSDSDLDLFIDYDPTAKIPNMFRLMQIEEKISETLGISVTITTRDALHPLMKKSIERDAVRVT
jgi:predicted nucleotidyltransferase